MASAISMECVSAPVPAATSTSRISSVAYADEESASEEKTASAFVLGRRCSSASSDEMGDPMATLRTRDQNCCALVRGAVARLCSQILLNS